MRKELIEMEETTAERSCFDAFILYKDRLFEGILRPMLIYKLYRNRTISSQNNNAKI